MIKFFRKIRYDLMGKSKTGKPAYRAGRYLKYAIGEIILVVIGIIVAIQLNEWRNDTNNEKQRQNILKSLEKEFNSNISQLDTVLFYQMKIKSAYPRVMELIKADTTNMDDLKYQEPYKNLGWSWTFDPINGALRSAISSGEIHLIKNDKLIELLFSWEDIVRDSEEEAIRLRNHQQTSTEFTRKHIRIWDPWTQDIPELKSSNYPSDYKGLFKDVLFEDYASTSFMWALEYIVELNIIRTNNLEILNLIEQELKE